MADSLSAHTTDESNSTYPSMGEGEDDGVQLAAGGTPPDGEDVLNDVFESFDITVEQTLIEVRDTGRERVQWRAECDGESVVSDSIMDAVMGAIAAANGGELP